MRSIQRRYKEIRRRNPAWSTYVCFGEAIAGQGFGDRALHDWFNRLVDIEDCPDGNRHCALRYLKNREPP
jgi:hypothetical protein